ncbi:hypothetical protein T484DRAFT_3076330 [Baffinella frigidus]|nr:hypothetical protein T484DRAFT_3076330 [Cryptophyta sp. CCMP2293]
MGMLKRFFSRSKGSASPLTPSSIAATHPGNNIRPGAQESHSFSGGNGFTSNETTGGTDYPSDTTVSQQQFSVTSPAHLGSHTTAVSPPAVHRPAMLDESEFALVEQSFQEMDMDDVPAWPHATHPPDAYTASAAATPSSSVAQWGGFAASAPQPAKPHDAELTPARAHPPAEAGRAAQPTPKRPMQEIPSTVSCRRHLVLAPPPCLAAPPD